MLLIFKMSVMKTSGLLKALFWLSLAGLFSCSSQKILETTLRKDKFLKSVAENPLHEVSIILTQVDVQNKKFISEYFQVSDSVYFYPASTVKMPVAILALQRLNELRQEGKDVKKDDVMLTAMVNERLRAAIQDTTTEHRKPTLERYIQRIFAISGNNDYNRIYEFLGPDYINESLLKNKTFTNSVINHRLSMPELTFEENRTTNNIRFFRDRTILYDKPEIISQKVWQHEAKEALKGVGYLDASGQIIEGPFDFRSKNFYTLKDMERTLQKVIFPEFFPEDERFLLTDEDYEFLTKSMSSVPGDYPFLAHDSTYYDSYVKFLMVGDQKTSFPPHIKIYNKSGMAYGYVLDCAYIENTKTKKGFFLTAVVHVNKNMIYNDGEYEYETIGLPFMGILGRKLYKKILK